jgi:hypothetical protein
LYQYRDYFTSTVVTVFENVALRKMFGLRKGRRRLENTV